MNLESNCSVIYSTAIVNLFSDAVGVEMVRSLYTSSRNPRYNIAVGKFRPRVRGFSCVSSV